MVARSNSSHRKSTVPVSRFARLLRLGLIAGEAAVGAAVEGARRFAGRPAQPGGAALLNLRSARKLAERLAKMRGAAMKLGQLLSMESPDLLPPELTQALSILRGGAYAMPTSQLRQVLGREYGKGWQARFASFDYEPVAAASIGQVHRARTPDGRVLALKIQYPGVARAIDSDVNNAAALLRLLNLLPLQLDVDAFSQEAKRQLRQEADYIQEADNLDRYRGLVAHERDLVAPQVHRDLTTKRVLAMDFLAGEPLESLAQEWVPESRRDAAGALLQRLMYRELFEFRFMQTDPNIANYLYDHGRGKVLLLDFGSAREFSAEFAARYACITRAIMRGDRKAARRYAGEIGYLAAGDSEKRVEHMLNVIFLVCEPLRHDGAYDFGASELPRRASELTMLPALRDGLLRAPPADTLFLHRKLVGSFLLCARIGARVDVRSLMLPFLERYRGS
jgi:predicted unusual protein kinase regulating ubiquinone biosynthesis (AarF/ABC1/UbiB family)